MHPRNTDKYCFGHLPPPCTASPAPQLRAHLRLLVVMIFAKGERNCTGRTVSEHLANRKAGKAHNKHAQMLTFSVARSPRRVIPRQDPIHLLINFGVLLVVGARPVPSAAYSRRQKKVCARAVNLFDKFPQVKYNCHINRIFANISTDLGPVSFYRIAARCDYWTQNSRRNRQGDFCFLLATGSDTFANLFFCFPIVFYRVPLQANMLTFFRY